MSLVINDLALKPGSGFWHHTCSREGRRRLAAVPSF
jgi:hypothetical protein